MGRAKARKRRVTILKEKKTQERGRKHWTTCNSKGTARLQIWDREDAIATTFHFHTHTHTDTVYLPLSIQSRETQNRDRHSHSKMNSNKRLSEPNSKPLFEPFTPVRFFIFIFSIIIVIKHTEQYFILSKKTYRLLFIFILTTKKIYYIFIHQKTLFEPFIIFLSKKYFIIYIYFFDK